mmetsp:Transcript_51621/g.95556  ORF Transcript_51621/g.95556 Transcript_51621/m.95556 type:complete len:553 (-) Transcript_51621:20-1678(-)
MLCNAACRFSRCRAPAVTTSWQGMCRGKGAPLGRYVLEGRRFAGDVPLAPGTVQSGLMTEDRQQSRPLVRCTMKALGLQTFSKEELEEAFRAMDTDGSGHLTHAEVVQVFQTAAGNGCGPCGSVAEAEAIASHLMVTLDRNNDDKLTFDEFHLGLTKLAAERDSRVWSIAASMLVTGVSVGAAIPAMPLLVQQLGMTEAQFGYTISAFGLAKLLANVPAGLFVDMYSRRGAMALGLLLNSVGMAGCGMAGSFPELAAARFVAGMGASFIVGGAMTAVADISSPLNRARMLAPVMSGFSAGTVLGPAVGGSLIGAVGLGPTFALVSGGCFANAAATQIFMKETKAPDSTIAETSILKATRSMFEQWGPIWQNPEIKMVLFVNTAYWVALSGCNMTLLPLLLAKQFGLAAPQIGMVIAMSSTVSVLGAGPAAMLADRIGPGRLFAPSFVLTALPMAALPMAGSLPEGALAIALMSLGNVGLSSTPAALVSSLSSNKDRAQALTLTRTMGDVGWLFGGFSIGILASILGTAPALQVTASFLLVVAGWVSLRHKKL